jgi:hypothetical protein
MCENSNPKNHPTKQIHVLRDVNSNRFGIHTNAQDLFNSVNPNGSDHVLMRTFQQKICLTLKQIQIGRIPLVFFFQHFEGNFSALVPACVHNCHCTGTKDVLFGQSCGGQAPVITFMK